MSNEPLVQTKIQIIEVYHTKKPTFQKLERKILGLLTDLLSDISSSIHNIDSRIKDEHSLENKIDKKEKYTSIDQITDIVGLRVVTFFEEDTSAIAEIIRNEFHIDESNSIDKAMLLAPNEFGYRSVHLVCELKQERLSLLEYKGLGNVKFEIQIRSVLQHAWAEMQHDLGYKSQAEVPKVIQRRLALIAGNLELMDREFNQTRTQLKTYEESLSNLIETEPETVSIDLSSLRKFYSDSTDISSLDKKITVLFGNNSSLANVDDRIISNHIPRLNELGVKDMKMLSALLKANAENITNFVPIFLNRNGARAPTPQKIPSGISIFYLQYLLLAKRFQPEEQKAFLQQHFGVDESIMNPILKVLQTAKETYNIIDQVTD